MSRMAVPEAITTTWSTLGGRPALLVEPVGESESGTILYFHGGSFSLGSPETALSLTANLVVRTGMRAWSLDYRLAPEDPFPAGGEDALKAYRALLDDGVDPSTIVFAGDSAGGGLTVTTLLRAREAGLPMPAAIVAFSPGLDSSLTGASLKTREGIDPLFTRKGLEHTASLYRGEQDPRQPLLSPAVYADPTGFPPMLLQVGTNELLLDDATRMAMRATDAGVDGRHRGRLDVRGDARHRRRGRCHPRHHRRRTACLSGLCWQSRRGGPGPRPRGAVHHTTLPCHKAPGASRSMTRSSARRTPSPSSDLIRSAQTETRRSDVTGAFVFRHVPRRRYGTASIRSSATIASRACRGSTVIWLTTSPSTRCSSVQRM